MKPILTMMFVAFGLSGCAAQLGPLLGAIGVDPNKATEIEAKAIDTAVKPVPVYCAAPVATRLLFRQRVNASPSLQGHQIGVWCVGDEPLTLGATAAPETAPVPVPAPAE